MDVIAGIVVHIPPGPDAIIPQSSEAVTEGDCRGTLREISKSSPATDYLPSDRGISNVIPFFKNGSREY